METELKFRVAGKLKAGMIERLDWVPFVLDPREAHPLRDVVLDTPDRILTGQKFALRIRHDAETIYMTLKGPPRGGGEGARHQRDEWEEALPDDAIHDRARWPEAIRAQLSELIGEHPLEPIVEVVNDRCSWKVRQDGRVVAEIALDEGEIRAGEKAQALHELEIERKGDGTEQDLDELARRLQQALPLAPQPRTKLERGLALGRRGAAPMEPGALLAEAGRSALRAQWKKLKAHEPQVREGDHDAVHDMRVATRRLRAMLEVLADSVYRPGTAGRLRKGLKRLAAALGAVRDTEVLLEAVADYSSHLAAGEGDGLDSLVRELNERRDKAREALLEELDRKRTHKLLDRLERFVTAAGAGVASEASEAAEVPLRVRDVAGSALWSRLETIQRYAPLMPEAPLPLLHRLRIACKHLRYTIELFEDALIPEAVALREDLMRAQDHLGTLHDLVVLLPLVDGLLQTSSNQQDGLQRYRAHLEVERDRLWMGTAALWSTIGSSDFRARLAGVIAAL